MMKVSVTGSMSRSASRSSSEQSQWRRVIVVGLIAVASLISSVSVAEPSRDKETIEDASAAIAVEEPIDWEMVGLSTLDAVILRPLGVVTTVGGFAMFLVSVPFVAPSGHTATAWDVFVYGSFDDTFVRPLGEI